MLFDFVFNQLANLSSEHSWVYMKHKLSWLLNLFIYSIQCHLWKRKNS